MKILFTPENGFIKETYFPPDALVWLERTGEVVYNPKESPFTGTELSEAIRNVDICVTHWGCPTFTASVLESANQLKLIAHAAGSVGDLLTEAVFQKSIKVCSANRVLAKYVAESVLADILAGLRLIPLLDQTMKKRLSAGKTIYASRSLFGAKIGLVGLGAIGFYLLDLLAPFDVQIKVYDPYLPAAALEGYPNVELCPLDEALRWGEIISIHASLTPETHGLIDAGKLKQIRDGALFVNTARGAIVDENALTRELQQGRLSAVLDVFTVEPLPLESSLRDLDNVILLPHVAGITSREQMSYAMIEEIERYANGQPLLHEIPVEKFLLMTRERDS
ncbi:MAG: hydroxyacid dehydrogenase [Chloroflexota bacterium]